MNDNIPQEVKDIADFFQDLAKDYSRVISKTKYMALYTICMQSGISLAQLENAYAKYIITDKKHTMPEIGDLLDIALHRTDAELEARLHIAYQKLTSYFDAFRVYIFPDQDMKTAFLQLFGTYFNFERIAYNQTNKYIFADFLKQYKHVVFNEHSTDPTIPIVHNLMLNQPFDSDYVYLGKAEEFTPELRTKAKELIEHVYANRISKRSIESANALTNITNEIAGITNYHYE